MRVAVVGAGIVGVTTAYELAADGHEVTVFERRGSVAAEASFAHAGLVAPGCELLSPASAGLRALLGLEAPVRFGGWPDAAAWRWLWRGRRAGHGTAEQEALYRLARDSAARLAALAAALKIEHEQAHGLLVLLRSARDVALARPGLKRAAELGVDFHLVDAQRCRSIEPGLNAETPLHAGVHLAQASLGNCRQFAHALRLQAQRLGAQFRFDETVQALDPAAPLVLRHARTDAEAPQPAEASAFDAVVVCAAMSSLPLIARLGVKLPMVPVHGYSVTAPLRHVEGYPGFGPQAALVDARHRVTITRLGQRVRVTGGAEIGGPAERLHAPSLATLYRVLHDWFPGATQLAQAQRWKGTRPMPADGAPIVGASGVRGVWLNVGHGSDGWTLACGSARQLADALAGRPAAAGDAPLR